MHTPTEAARTPRLIEVPAAWGSLGVHLVACSMEGPPPPPWAGEEAGTSVTARRLREFAFGRACARQALRDTGRPVVPIPRRPDRSPSFPPGVVGSISHSEALAVAAVASSERLRSLGVDVELAGALGPELRLLVEAPGERPAAGPLDRLFSAKEAAFKCWFAAGGGRIAEFHEFELRFAPDGSFAVLRQPAPAIDLVGRWAVGHGHWWTLCAAVRAIK